MDNEVRLTRGLPVPPPDPAAADYHFGFVAPDPVRVVIVIECDDITRNELTNSVFRAISRIVTDGEKRSKGDPVKRKSGCCGDEEAAPPP